MESTSRMIIYNSADKTIPSKLDLKEGYILIKRTKFIDSKEYVYYTIPGGHVEEGETFEEAGIREIEEELNIKVEINDILLDMVNEDLKRREKFYFASYKSGILDVGNGPEFTNPDPAKYGTYEIVTVDKDKIKSINLLPKEIKEKL